jgi:predicted MFS family arabinose efflux permease
MLQHLQKRIRNVHRDLLLFLASIALVGFGESIVNSVFNNYLSETFKIGGLQRTVLEFPRELPGFLVIFISAALFFIRSRRLAVFAMLASAAGLICMAFLSVNFHWMFVWLFIFSVGVHLFLPLATSIAMGLSSEGSVGKRLGQLNAIRNSAIVLGSLFVALGFKLLHFSFTISFVIAAAFYIVAALFIFFMDPGQTRPPAATHLKLYKEYRLYYLLSILFGTRKQIFLTFAPWVLVTIFRQPTTILASLLTVSGIAGIFFQPLLGKAIDKVGEKTVLMGEAILLVGVCLGYGFGRTFFSETIALVIAAACFIVDQLLMSVNMARSTYLKKIALHPDHVASTLTMSVTIDHVFSIGIALIGGVIWARWGYQTVFLGGAFIALFNLVTALFIKIPAWRGF